MLSSEPMPSQTHTEPRHDPQVMAWLWLLFSTLFFMVMLGGITRLTGSGLSMVDWRPLMGVLPPMGDEQWNAVFEAYQTSPQYLEVNSWMQLDDFKQIFFWEYLHRLAGRAIGLVSIVPWLYFTLRGKLERWLSIRVVVAIVLGGAQGLLGWFMVQSGLVDRPSVSHFRLAAHLMLAFFIAQWILFTLLDLHWGRSALAWTRTCGMILCLSAVLALQILYGAFMAGTHAGLLFPSFPDMNGGYAPAQFFPLDSLWDNLLFSPIAIHYVHRTLGFALLALTAAVLFALRRVALEPAWTKTQFVVVLAVQFALGAFTALYQVPLVLAVAHQSGAFVLACSLTLLLHRSAAADSRSRALPSAVVAN